MEGYVYTGDIEVDVINILLLGLEQVLRDKFQYTIIYVTPLMELGAFRWPECVRKEYSIQEKIYKLREYIEDGDKEGYCISRNITPLKEYPEKVEKITTRLVFHSYSLGCLYTYRSRCLRHIPEKRKYEDDIFDFANFETIYFLLTSKYKKKFDIIIRNKTDNEMKKYFGAYIYPSSLQLMAVAAMKHTKKYSFLTFPTVYGSGDDKKTKIGQQLLLFEKNVIKKGKGEYMYCGTFPLELLDIKKRSFGCTVYVEENSLKKSIREQMCTFKDTYPLYFSSNVLGYIIYMLSSDIDRCISPERYIYNIIVVKKLRPIYYYMISTSEDMKEKYIHHTIALGPLIRLPEYNVCIHVINHGLHVQEKDFFLTDNDDDDCYDVFFTENLLYKHVCESRNIKKKINESRVEEINRRYSKYIRLFEPSNLHKILYKTKSICYDGMFL